MTSDMPEYFRTLKEKTKVCGGADNIDYAQTRIAKLCTRIEYTNARDIDLELIRVWCHEQFGNNWVWKFNDFYFKNPEDATVFKLTWC